MLKKHIPGSCVVSLTIDIAGNSHDVHIVSSTPDASDKKLRGAILEMQDQSVKAVKQYRFKPATFNGNPVPVETTVGIDFQIF
jgi:outer membrane biosynthesis protein TonB